MQVAELWQFPIKGLGGTTIAEASLTAGGYFPGDRLYAIGNGHSKWDDTPAGTWMKKSFFLQIMKFEQLAALQCGFANSQLSISRNGTTELIADMDSADGRDAIDSYFAQLMGDLVPGAPRLMKIDSGAYTDTNKPWISFGGTASLEAFAKATDTVADARRFRLNMIMETSEPFIEASLIGKDVAIGDMHCQVVEPVGRCAAIDVDPETAERGPSYLRHMQSAFGHTDLGVFAQVTKGGTIRPGDTLRIL